MRRIATWLRIILMLHLFIVLNGCSVFDPRLSFYGKFVDQHGAPAPNVRMDYNTTRSPEIPAPMVGHGTDHGTVTSDGDGRISINQAGLELQMLRFDEDKYLFSHAGRTFAERFNVPANAIWPTGEMSASNPVIIPVWKRERAITLQEDGKAIYSPQGTNIIREPITGTPMVLEIEWNATGSDRSPGLWSVKLKVLNGAIQETDSAFPFEAPVSGYQAEWIGGAFSQPSVDSLSKNFYIVDADKKYFGRLHATIKPYFGTKKHIGLRWWINPNGERGLLNNTASGD